VKGQFTSTTITFNGDESPTCPGQKTQIRLIDTPAIGDTDGSEQHSAEDKSKMDCIIHALGTVDELHGIVVLLKPYQSRLDLMVNFCLKSLLHYVHRNVAPNVAFGFIDSRNSSFRPGETYGLLAKILKDEPSFNLRLGRRSSFFFDVDGFKCLAAHSKGVDIYGGGNISNFQANWTNSASEVSRVLDHFEQYSLRKEKLSQTRHNIRILTKPMVSQLMCLWPGRPIPTNFIPGRCYANDQR
jgi:hypothetical protein